jgi:hypothetical protein
VIIEKAFIYPEERKTTKEPLVCSSITKTLITKQKKNLRKVQKKSKDQLKKANTNNKTQNLPARESVDIQKHKYYIPSNP